MYCAAYLRSLVPGQSYLELCRLADADQLENGLRFARVTRAKGLVVSIGEVSFSYYTRWTPQNRRAIILNL